MQDPRLYVHTNMHGNQSDEEHTESMQQCLIPAVDEHQGQLQGFVQHSALGEHPDRPGRLHFLSAPSLLQGAHLAEGKDLHCSGCQDSANQEGDLHSHLRRLNLGETNVFLVKRQEREPFHHHDGKVHCTDIRYPEPLATEESPRRRARSLPWNSIPEEDEEDSLMCCCKLKKKVQFADSLGLTLASVKHFLPSDEPLVPQAVLARLQSYPPTTCGPRSELILEDEFSRAELGPSEATPVELLERLEEQGVCLEQVSASRFGVFGYVLVKDSGEKAQVKVRYTFNGWLSFLDCPATSAGQSATLPPPGCQRFHFNLCYPPTTSSIQFAICFSTGQGQEMWDNNKGANYTISCQQGVNPEIQPSSPDQEEWEGSRLW